MQGEEQKKLDVLSNEVFVKALVSSGRTVMHSPTYTSVHVPMFISYLYIKQHRLLFQHFSSQLI